YLAYVTREAPGAHPGRVATLISTIPPPWQQHYGGLFGQSMVITVRNGLSIGHILYARHLSWLKS
ncbi:hypothetical protein JMJ77_0015248, partial [Colletotrichum scovillei]